MIELTGKNIYAVPYRKRRRLKAIRLPDGAIVERPTPEQRLAVPKGLPAAYEIPGPGNCFVGLAGVFLLPTGDVAAVYGSPRDPASIEP